MLALDFAAGLVLLVGGDLDNGAVGAGLVDLPAADLGDELLKGLTAPQVKPLLENLGVDLTECLANLNSDADADQLLEAGDIGGQIGVEIIGVQGGPELSVLGRLKERGEARKLLNGFNEVGGLRCGLGLGAGGEGLSVGGEQGEAKRESRGWENGKRLSKDVGDGLSLEKVGVELVAAQEVLKLARTTRKFSKLIQRQLMILRALSEVCNPRHPSI